MNNPKSTAALRRLALLPKLEELYKDIDLYQKRDALSFLLNQNPPDNWIKQHPIIKNHKYLPIDKVEYLLRTIIKDYNIEVLREGSAFNGIYVVIRLHYLDIISGAMKYHDGIGAAEMQTKKDTSASDLSNIRSGALAMAFPIAETLAIKDAADKLGRIFGADLNRKALVPTTYDTRLLSPEEKLDKIEELLEEALNSGPDLKIHASDFEFISRIIDNKEVNSYDKAIKLLTQKLSENGTK